MTLPLELGAIADANIRRAFEQIALNWPQDDKTHAVGGAGEPAFQGTWVNFGAPFGSASFYRRNDRVYLSGCVKTGVINTAVFTLPVGYRPGFTGAFAIPSAAAFGIVTVDAAGNVIPTNGNNASVFLDGIHFRVA